MPLLCVQGDKVTAVSFTPSNPLVTSTEFVTVGGSNQIIVVGDDVESHTNFIPNPDIVHASPSMTSQQQSFFKISGKLVILNGDRSSCDPSHIILAGTQDFITVTP
jgi:hypothetical protein